MKTSEKILEEHNLINLHNQVTAHKYDVVKAMEEYALKAMKADRERVAEKAKTTRSCSVWNCEGESVDKESILNLPYELP